MKKKIFILLFLAFYLSVSCFQLLLAEVIFIEIDDTAFISKAVSLTNAEDLQAFTYESYRFAVFKENEEIKFFIISTDYSQITGYRGKTTLGIILKEDMTVESIEIIDSEDTRGYVRRITSMGFTQRFENYRQGDEIEIITGATLTSKAIIDTLNECMEVFEKIVREFGIEN